MTLELDHLTAHYGRAQILFGISLAVAPGEAVALLGRNGAGKSTTLRAVMGLLARRAGRVTYAGRDVSRMPTHAIARLGLGYVPEDRRIFADLTVAENLEVGRQPPRGAHDAWTPERLYDLFPSLAALRGRRGGQMSGGEQQMLALARTLMGNPATVLLDEPSEGLAPRVLEQMAAAILAMKRQGIGLLLCEQNLGFARRISDRACLIERGRIVFDGALAALDADPGLMGRHLAL